MKRVALIAVVLVAVTAQVRSQSGPPRVTPTTPIRSMLDGYCAGCHSSTARAGGVAFSELPLDTIGEHAEIWEKTVQKMRGRLMPPPGSRQPTQVEVDAFISALEETLDKAPGRPVAGHVPIQRMTRTEYGIAVKDLLGVDIDAERLLPTENEVEGFDNIAAALSISPAFLDQYVGAARLAAKLAVGEPIPKLSSARYRGGFPIRDSDGNVVFVYIGNGEESNVRLTGDFRPSSYFNVYWDGVGEPMTRVGSIFYTRRRFETDARLDYKFVVDGKDSRDPLNSRTLISGTGGGEVSELVMPGHRTLEIAPVDDRSRQGTLHALEEPWAQPKVMIYLPTGYDPAGEYATIYTADGNAWVDLIGLPVILDRLIAERAIEPVIVVMIDAGADRSSWYSYNPDYLTYLQRVVQHVDSRYATRRRPEARLHAGTSAGGRATLYAGLELPRVFQNLAMLSPSFSGPLYYFEPYFSGRKRPDPSLRIWMSAGTYEGSLYQDAQAMEAYFKSTNILIKTVYVHQGHSFGAWREGAVEMLLHFFPAKRR